MNLNSSNSKILLECLIDRMDMPLVTLTKEFKIKEYNAAFEKILGVSNNLTDRLFEEVVGKINVSLENIIAENVNMKEINCKYISKHGSITHLHGFLIKKENEIFIIFKNFLISESTIVNEISKMNVEMSNLTRELTKKNIQLKRANEKITKLMNTDFLTGIPNRKYFFDRLEELVSLKKRKECLNIGVIFIDIDFFKKVNDTYGHDVGDLVLIRFSEVVRENLRREDIFARIGGEEFCVIAQCIGTNCLFEIAEKLRKAIEAMEIDNIDGKITASFGATFYKDEEAIDDFVKRADSNMYIAKTSGRNRTIFK